MSKKQSTDHENKEKWNARGKSAKGSSHGTSQAFGQDGQGSGLVGKMGSFPHYDHTG